MLKSSYKLIHFVEQEFVPPEVYNDLIDEKYSLTSIIDSKLLWTADKIREFFNKPMTINTWHKKGEFSLRGFRPKNCSIGAFRSQHKSGNAIDFDIQGLTADQVRNVILKNQKTYDGFKYITRMEAGVNWVHIDLKQVDNFTSIILFDP